MIRNILLLGVVLALGSGCSVKRFAVNQVGNAMAGTGGAFAADDDPELIRAAVPFGLKLEESLLAESPRHRGLLLATCSGFTQYAYAFVLQDADELEGKDLAASRALRERARKLFQRARDYGLRGLEVSHPGFTVKLRQDAVAAAKLAGKADVPLLFWTAAAWGGTIVLSKDNPDVVADVPKLEALIDRAAQLDPTFERGAIHGFLISYDMARTGLKPAEALARADRHLARALELAGGNAAGPYVSYAEAVCIKQQDRKRFEDLLNKAVSVDVNQVPELRLANLIAQRRAKWLLGRMEELFVE